VRRRLQSDQTWPRTPSHILAIDYGSRPASTGVAVALSNFTHLRLSAKPVLCTAVVLFRSKLLTTLTKVRRNWRGRKSFTKEESDFL